MTIKPACRSLLLRQLLMPLAVFAALILFLEASELDLRLADLLYRLSGGTWSLRDAWLTRDVLHEGGRRVVGLILLTLLGLLVASVKVRRLQAWRRSLAYLLLSALVAGLLVNGLKRVTHMDCPWDLARYGGDLPYLRLFEPHPGTFRVGACFPAGHASAGYAWLGLYFVAREWLPAWRRWVLLGVLMVGLAFGIAQQLRGAHFFSHDLWTLAICWSVAVLVYVAFGCRLRSPAVQN